MKEDKSPRKQRHMAGMARHGEHPKGDLGQIIFLLVFLVIWILDSFVFIFSTVLAPHVPFFLRAILAGLILLLAIYLVRSGHRAISGEILTSPRLLDDGAFARVRHPLYLAALLFYLFLIILTLSLISILVFLCVFIFYNFIAAYEENFLEKQYGQDFRDYKKNVPRWIPRI